MYIFTYLIIYMCVCHMGGSQIIRSGARSKTTPVPYPRSIPAWRIRPIPLFHNYFCSIPTLNMPNLNSIFVHTYMSTHTYMVAYMQRYVSYAVLASLCLQHWQLLPTLPRLYCVMVGMCLAASSWQSNSFSTCTTYSCFPLCAAVLYDGRGVLGWWPSLLLNLWQVCAAPLAVAARCVMVRMRLAAVLLSLQTANSDKDVLRAGIVPYPDRPCTTPWPSPRMNKWQIYFHVLRCFHIECS